ncbi:capsule biosynthesis [Lasius niger]|uniref:Capsule biosynthesis n=1 Tax=Lasius niger TaxID=67767 RepID=A0A0J7KD76_LASNI|nr:capsule biosynthesis [Lasius niger]
MNSNETNTKTRSMSKGEEEAKGSKPGPKSSKIKLKDIRPVSVLIRREEIVPRSGPSREPNYGNSDRGAEHEELVDAITTTEKDVYVPNTEEEPLPKKRKHGRPVTTCDFERLDTRPRYKFN